VDEVERKLHTDSDSHYCQALTQGAGYPCDCGLTDYIKSREIAAVKAYKDALEVICHIAGKEHLGRPRSSDKSCVFCISYLTLNPGAYGENLDLEQLLKDHLGEK
jgi:hypothetical protein